MYWAPVNCLLLVIAAYVEVVGYVGIAYVSCIGIAVLVHFVHTCQLGFHKEESQVSREIRKSRGHFSVG
jgi:hypothetical protein